MSAPEVVVSQTTSAWASDAATRVIRCLVAAQTARGVAHVCLTGGRSGNAVMSAMAESGSISSIDWTSVHVWWGDERFLPYGDPDRNDTAAMSLLLDRVDLPASHIHRMPAPGDQPDVDAAAQAYANALSEYAGASDPTAVPSFDLCLLGLGPDAHVASLFPQRPEVRERGHTVIAVLDSPKPPPTRITVTLPTINSSREVFLLASGADKASAVLLTLAEHRLELAPASGVHGRSRTLLLVDLDAAGQLPQV